MYIDVYMCVYIHKKTICIYTYIYLNIHKKTIYTHKNIYIQKIHTHTFCAGLSHSVVSDSLWPHGLQPTRLFCPRDSPGKNPAVGCHALLQGIFPNQWLNPGLPHCRLILYHLSYQGSPWILAWVAFPSSGGSSQPRNQTRVHLYIFSIIECKE